LVRYGQHQDMPLVFEINDLKDELYLFSFMGNKME
jgi:hypothetical protein